MPPSADRGDAYGTAYEATGTIGLWNGAMGMSKKHRDRSWPPAPEPLGTPVTDNHTHLAAVTEFAEEMSRQAAERGQEPVPVYTPDIMLDQAAAVGVHRVIDVGCELPYLRTAVDLARAHPGTVFSAVAIHPNEAVLHGHRGAVGPDGLELDYKPWHDVPFDEALGEVERIARENPKIVVAIGETGLDYFRTGEAARRFQREAFSAHMALARELSLPMQIHDRDAHGDVIDLLLRNGAPERTVFHSYSAGPDVARAANEHGWYLSFSGTVSYKGNDSIREALHIIDRHHILVETDAPYLPPVPYRGRTNSPYMIPYTLRSMADTLGMDAAALARMVEANTREVYGI